MSSKSILCIICEKKFTKQRGLKIHMTKMHKEDVKKIKAFIKSNSTDDVK